MIKSTFPGLGLLLVEQHAICGQKLIEYVEVSNIPRQDDPPALERLKVEARIVQQKRLFRSLNA